MHPAHTDTAWNETDINPSVIGSTKAASFFLTLPRALTGEHVQSGRRGKECEIGLVYFDV